MDFSHVVIQAMLSLPQYAGDRADTPEQRAELYRPVAQEIANVTRGNRTAAAALVTLGWFETRFARYVLSGNCASGPVGMRCDWDHRTKRPRARGAYQIWGWCTEAWKHPEGSQESLVAETRCAARMLSGAKRRCAGAHPAGPWAGAFSGYGGVSCIRPKASKRARRMAQIEARLRR